MSGTVLRYSPQSKAFTAQGPDGRWAPKAPATQAVVGGQQGVVDSRPQTPPGPRALTQK